jgi:hypothetical protein
MVRPFDKLTAGDAQGATDAAASHDEWARVGEYLDRLAFENDRLEAELKLKKERRVTRDTETAVISVSSDAPSAQTGFNEARETVRYEAQSATDAAQGMHLSYDALKRDLSGIMSDLNDFKHTRAGLESRLQS